MAKEPSNNGAPGASMVNITGIVVVITYLAVCAALLLYLLVALWPVPTPSGKPPPGEVELSATSGNTAPHSTTAKQTSGANETAMEPVKIFCWQWNIADEVRLLMLVICAGAVGSLVHGLRSIYWYIGNRDLVWSWVPKYLLLPFSGSVLAVVFYFVIRGGFFSPEAGFKQTSPFGFAALSAMVGMFSEQAVLKLKEIAETVLAKPEKGKNADPEREDK